jgi:hypothetical protein
LGRDEDISSTVVSVSGKALASLYDRYQERLFARNIRGYQGQTDVNDGIREAITKTPSRFFFLNNGITMLADSCERSGSDKHPSLKLTNPQIVNGQQTTRTIASMAKSGFRVSVLAKVVALRSGDRADRADVDDLLRHIVRASNSQNSVSASDLLSNDARQIWLDRALQAHGFGYLRKRMSRTEARRRFGGRKMSWIKRKDLASAIAATMLDPAEIRRGENHLFEHHYDELFALDKPFDYLARWRLFEATSRVSKRRNEWGYAKWAVIFVVWSALQRVLSAQSRRMQWTKLHSDKNGKLNRATEQLITVAFKCSMQLFRSERTTGQDVSSFFKNRSGLHLRLDGRLPNQKVKELVKRIGVALEAE